MKDKLKPQRFPQLLLETSGGSRNNSARKINTFTATREGIKLSKWQNSSALGAPQTQLKTSGRLPGAEGLWRTVSAELREAKRPCRGSRERCSGQGHGPPNFPTGFGVRGRGPLPAFRPQRAPRCAPPLAGLRGRAGPGRRRQQHRREPAAGPGESPRCSGAAGPPGKGGHRRAPALPYLPNQGASGPRLPPGARPPHGHRGGGRGASWPPQSPWPPAAHLSPRVPVAGRRR